MDDLHRPYLLFKGVGNAKCEGISAYPCAFAGTRICSGSAASSKLALRAHLLLPSVEKKSFEALPR